MENETWRVKLTKENLERLKKTRPEEFITKRYKGQPHPRDSGMFGVEAGMRIANNIRMIAQFLLGEDT